MTKLFLPALAMVLAGAGAPAAMANQAHKRPHKPAAASTPANSSPSRAGDLNSPSTDFSGVSPVIDDPKAEMLKPRKKKDLNFD